jgi:tetratricopeptide (TPR) repeat protein
MNAAMQELSRIAMVYRKLGKFNLATNVYTNIISRLSKQRADTVELAVAYYDLGECYADQGRHERAHNAYRAAAHVYSLARPDEATGYFHYGDTLRKLGDLASSYHRTHRHDEVA